MERTLIKVVINNDGMEVEAAGTTTELLAAITNLIAKLSKSSGISIEVMCFAIMTGARRFDSSKKDKPNVDETIDNIFDEIVRRKDI